AEERGDGARAIEEGVGTYRGGDAEGDAAQRGEEQTARGEHEGRLVAVQHLVEHGALHPERAAEIAAGHVSDPMQVLDVERLGETEPPAPSRPNLPRPLRTPHELRRNPRREMQAEADHDADAP